MLLKRLYDRSKYDPEALAAARTRVKALLADLARARSKDEAADLMAKLREAKAAERAATPSWDGVEVQGTGFSVGQNFSEQLVAEGMRQGWMTNEQHPKLGHVLVIHSHVETVPDPEKPNERTRGHEADYTYQVVRAPGYYCCHCGEAIEDANGRTEDGGTKGLEHVELEHPGLPSPDPNNPAGYRKLNGYECILVEG